MAEKITIFYILVFNFDYFMKVPTWWIGCNTLFNTKIQIFGSSTVEMNLTNHFKKCLEMQQYIFDMVNWLQNTWWKCKCLFAAENWKEYLWYFAQIYKSWTWWCRLTNFRTIFGNTMILQRTKKKLTEISRILWEKNIFDILFRFTKSLLVVQIDQLLWRIRMVYVYSTSFSLSLGWIRKDLSPNPHIKCQIHSKLNLHIRCQ